MSTFPVEKGNKATLKVNYNRKCSAPGRPQDDIPLFQLKKKYNSLQRDWSRFSKVLFQISGDCERKLFPHIQSELHFKA